MRKRTKKLINKLFKSTNTKRVFMLEQLKKKTRKWVSEILLKETMMTLLHQLEVVKVLQEEEEVVPEVAMIEVAMKTEAAENKMLDKP